MLSTQKVKAHGGLITEVTPEYEAGVRNLLSGGQYLPQSVRAFFEPRFGYDFSKVQVHTGSEAARMARLIDASAFTVGSDVIFGAVQYAPETWKGRCLLAHELTHVIQQSKTCSSLPIQELKLEGAGGVCKAKLGELTRNSAQTMYVQRQTVPGEKEGEEYLRQGMDNIDIQRKLHQFLAAEKAEKEIEIMDWFTRDVLAWDECQRRLRDDPVNEHCHTQWSSDIYDPTMKGDHPEADPSERRDARMGKLNEWESTCWAYYDSNYPIDYGAKGQDILGGTYRTEKGLYWVLVQNGSKLSGVILGQIKSQITGTVSGQSIELKYKRPDGVTGAAELNIHGLGARLTGEFWDDIANEKVALALERVGLGMMSIGRRKRKDVLTEVTQDE